MADEDNKSSSLTASSPLDAAADRIRETAKWLLAAFGAVGVVLVAGVALRDMGHVEDDPSLLLWAVIGAGLAVFGVIVAFLAAGSIVTRSFVTLEDLAKEKHAVTDPVLLGGFSDVESLWISFGDALNKTRETVTRLYEHQGQDIGESDAEKNAYNELNKELERKAQAATTLAGFYREISVPLLARQSFLQVRAAYGEAKGNMAAGVIAAVAGIILFVVATTQPTNVPIVGKTPAQVAVSIRDDQHQRFANLLGAKCDLKKISGTAIATEGNVIVVAVPASADCKEALLRLGPEDAAVTQPS